MEINLIKCILLLIHGCPHLVNAYRDLERDRNTCENISDHVSCITTPLIFFPIDFHLNVFKITFLQVGHVYLDLEISISFFRLSYSY